MQFEIQKVNKCVWMGILLFMKIVILGCKLLVLWLQIEFYGSSDASQ